MQGNFESSFQSADTNRQGSIDYTQYSFFLSSYFGSNFPFPETALNYMFTGMDIEDNGFVTREQLYKLIQAINAKDVVEINKLIFRGIDLDRDAKISKNDLLEIAEFNNITIKQSKLSKLGNLISFSQMMEILFSIHTDDLEPLIRRDITDETTESNDDFLNDNKNNKNSALPVFLALGVAAVACAGAICYFAFGKNDRSNEKNVKF